MNQMLNLESIADLFAKPCAEHPVDIHDRHQRLQVILSRHIPGMVIQPTPNDPLEIHLQNEQMQEILLNLMES